MRVRISQANSSTSAIYHTRFGCRLVLGMLLAVLLASCQPETASGPTPSPVVIAKLLATAYISPTPNAEQANATRLAASPTDAPIVPSVIPTITPYVGIFIGEAPQEPAFQPLTEPIFGLPADITPTANASRCRIPITLSFVALWTTDLTINRGLGCPIQEGFGFFGQAQVFDNGVIYYREETREVWAVLSGVPVGRYWYVAAPAQASTDSFTAPLGRRIPRGDIGYVWASIPELREAMGFAQTDLQRVALNLQRFDSGTFFLDATVGQIFSLLVDGSAYGPYDEPDISAESLLTPDAAVSGTPGETATPGDAPPPLESTATPG